MSLLPFEQLQLNKNQQDAISFLEQGYDFVLLQGNAGTGKTTVIAEFCKKYTIRKINVVTPTHKSAEILRSKIYQRNVHISTVHSFLHLERKLKGAKYEYVFSVDNLEKIECDLLIIDEVSMFDKELLRNVIFVAEQLNFKIIFVGDRKQLPPVGFCESPVFDLGLPTFDLTEVVRHSNDIYDLSQNLHWLNARKNGSNFKWVEAHEVPIDLLIQSNGSDYAKFITWTNRTVSIINREVRKAIYSDPYQVEIGETLLLRQPFRDLYRNNEEIKVTNVVNGFLYYKEVNILHPEIQTLVINDNLVIVADEDIKKHQQNIKYLEESAKARIVPWRIYYDYLEQFADYQYNHAITVHKSQGSTYDFSIINVSEIFSNPDACTKTKMLYTAVTRASNTNYFL